MEALIDSGSDSNLLDVEFVKNCQIGTELISPPLKVNALNGELLTIISEQTSPLRLHLAGNHIEKITFHVIPSSHSPLVLGLPWLQKHNPAIDRVSGWSSFLPFYLP